MCELYHLNSTDTREQFYLMFQKYATLILFFFISLYSCVSFATQHALVVGINVYPKGHGIETLEGAVNDAELLRDTLRRIQVQLPDERVLLNDKATRANVIKGWHDMVSQANRGDTLIFTFSGHGGQIDDTAPLDEDADAVGERKDETLVLYDADITDDELMDLFINASDYKIIFVADACHSGGLTTKGSQCRSRFAGKSSAQQRPRIPALNVKTTGDQKENPSHVTFIAAQDSDNLKVCEHPFGHRYHGALSWFLAKALEGNGDSNKNGVLEPFELEKYLGENISSETDGKQIPKLKSKSQDMLIMIGGSSQQGIKDKKPLLQALSNINLKPVKIVLQKNGNLTEHSEQHFRSGDRIRFIIGEVADTHQGFKAMTLFNLTGNGELQFLYPLSKYKHPLTINKFPYKLPALKVKLPFGEDHFIAILCTEPPKSLHEILSNSAPNIPKDLTKVISALQEQLCKLGQYVFLTGE